MINEKKLIKDICNKEINISEEYKLKPNELNAFLDGLNRKQIAVMECISNQPHVGEWIPCYKDLPKDNTPVQITILHKDDGRKEVVRGWREGETWILDTLIPMNIIIIMAWKPLPEPWEGEI